MTVTNDVPCAPADHSGTSRDDLTTLPDLLQDPTATGLNRSPIVDAAHRDPDVAEFTRFYLERRAQEVASAGEDARKRKKLEDEFTPRIEITLVAMQGETQRHIRANVRYRIQDAEYSSELTIIPREGRVASAPDMGECDVTGLTVPVDCLAACALSGSSGLKHRLVRSDVSGRFALPVHAVRCMVSDKQLLMDEAGMSDITRAVIDLRLLKTCAITGKKAEPAYMRRCLFSKTDVLKDRLAVSEVSNKPYRADQRQASAVSGKTGHQSEFIACHETRLPLAPGEAERCMQTGKLVRPGILVTCAATGKRVLPSELETSAVSGKRVLRNALVNSSVSGARFLETEGLRSAYGKFCAPVEAKRCEWSGVPVHPDDLRTCSLLGLPVHFQYLAEEINRLSVLDKLLRGTRRTADAAERWDDIRAKAAASVSGRARIESAELSPDGRSLAVCAEVKSMLGFRTQYAGFLYELDRKTIVGRIALVKRDSKGGTVTKAA